MKKWILVLLSSCVMGFVSAGAGEVPTAAEEICPILVGETLPELPVRQIDGESATVQEIISGKPAVILFYRGGWCPYCNTHLQEVQKIEEALLAEGVTIVALSPDRPEKLRSASDKNGVNYTLLSDSSMAASRALGIAFELPQETVTLYKDKYGIDVEGDSGETHHQLPVPTALVVDGEGVVQFTYINPDYKSRVSGSLLLEAVRSLKK